MSVTECSKDQFKFIEKIREKQAESGVYTDASMERSYKKLLKLDLPKLEELSKLNIRSLKHLGY